MSNAVNKGGKGGISMKHSDIRIEFSDGDVRVFCPRLESFADEFITAFDEKRDKAVVKRVTKIED